MSILRGNRCVVNCGLVYCKTNRFLDEFRFTRGLVALLNQNGAQRHGSNFDEALCVNEAPALDPDWATADCKKLEALQRSSGTDKLYLSYSESVTKTNGVPISPNFRTTMYIRRSVKFATMSGTAHTQHWRASWEAGPIWTEPLLDWTSSSDPYASMLPLTFPDETSAVNFCEKNEYSWYKQMDPPLSRNPIIRRYEDNFHWCRRCRLSTR